MLVRSLRLSCPLRSRRLRKHHRPVRRQSTGQRTGIGGMPTPASSRSCRLVGILKAKNRSKAQANPRREKEPRSLPTGRRGRSSEVIGPLAKAQFVDRPDLWPGFWHGLWRFLNRIPACGHVWDMPAGRGIFRLSEETGSKRPTVKAALLTRGRRSVSRRTRPERISSITSSDSKMRPGVIRRSDMSVLFSSNGRWN
jgi:hypothetical protein